MTRRLASILTGAVVCGLAGAAATFAVEPQGPSIKWEDTGPAPGVYFYWYEPSFYAGFAPRCQEPERIHLKLGRGNQFRVTIPLGPEQLDTYVDDLRLRRTLIQELIDKKVLELSTNAEYEKFVQKLDEAGIEALVQGRAGYDEQGWRDKAVEVMAALNPGRVFHVHRSLDELLKAWKDRLVTTPQVVGPDAELKLEIIESLLPGRIHLTSVPPELDAALPKLVELAREADRDWAAGSAAFAAEAQPFLEKATAGLYPIRDGHVDVWEFTAIYPAGTEQDFFDYQGKKVPDFGTTGVLPLIPREYGQGKVGMVDYISTNPAYGFMPLFAYQHGSGNAYNSIHNAGVRCPLGGTSFLAKAWNTAQGTRSTKRNYQNLWIISRGPVSHGCTRLASGHLAELRHILPSASEKIEKVRYFRNLPYTYDVFDIDADGTPEVMGVKYYLAFSTTKDRLPHKAWAPNTREAYYAWLYTDELRYAPDGSAYFDEALSCRFINRRSEVGKLYKNVKLYEPDYEPERIQFYRIRGTSFQGSKGVELGRELMRAGVGYDVSRKTLLLP